MNPIVRLEPTWSGPHRHYTSQELKTCIWQTDTEVTSPTGHFWLFWHEQKCAFCHVVCTVSQTQTIDLCHMGSTQSRRHKLFYGWLSVSNYPKPHCLVLSINSLPSWDLTEWMAQAFSFHEASLDFQDSCLCIFRCKFKLPRPLALQAVHSNKLTLRFLKFDVTQH